ncbi:MAG: MATE family efflux transporter [Bacteroidia bacterium]
MKSFWSTLRAAIQGSEEDFTTIPLRRAIVLLAIPMILEMAMESLFAVVDIFFVGRLGAHAVTAVGLTETVLTLVYALAIGLGTAVTALVARRTGERNPEGAALAAAQAIRLTLVLALLLGVAGYFGSAAVLRLMGADETVIAQGIGYTRTMFTGNGIIFFLFLLNGLFRGTGQAFYAMRALWLANIINMLLDPCLIFGLGPFPELGLTGAAVATNIGRGCGVLYQLYLLSRRSDHLPLRAAHFRFDWQTTRRLVQIAAGSIGQYIIGSASWIFLMRIMALFGSAVVAGYTISVRLIIFAILPAWGMSNAAATLVGQNLGAGHPDRAAAAAWQTTFYTMIFLVFMAITCIAFAPFLIGIFTPDPETLATGVQSLRIICLAYIFSAFGMVLGQALNGAGDTLSPLLINLFCFWLIQVPLAYVLATQLNLGPSGVYWAIVCTDISYALVSIAVFRQGRWKLKRV